ncbi:MULTISPECIES: DUF2326 domain-containing protein [Bacillus]|uniref:DUF2326 domain-containing protein n=1 Tax=Bacillus TaxID=1386 RepID=UPI000E72D53B|nr:DUF2326 domain-containing protein [Bacillus safensis]MBT2261406.1 DUF2326 domain-containing protein [Bacillus safensis]MCY1092525.1 DUF2326 domain-containing protein [Bacillus safensis]MEC0983280.1 DUF2326 domain-containing protein [Bacillus safensis]RKE74898.1 uncharacterized protein YydD (DUF2326 family) [Bacillus safensis]GLF86379.1 hypothetical protein R51_14240 [Bacillus safensis]
MFIKRLIIKETKPAQKIIRNIRFAKGMNFIVDAGKDQEKGNSVGKTTILKLIDICLGAKDKKFIYFDDETKQTNEILKNYIIDNKINVELEVVESFDEEDSTVHILSVDLYPRGKRYINGIEVNQIDYWPQLNEIFFSNLANHPTFRQLINMFVRIDQRADNNKFLKFLERTNDATYENIYSYLFEMQDQEISNQILDLRKEIAEKNKEIKNFMSINNFKSIDSVNQKVNLLKSTIDELNDQMNILVNSRKFKENEEKISEIKIMYSDYSDRIDELLFKRKRIIDILEDAEQEIKNAIDKEVLRNLYNETLEAMGELHKEFEDLVKFNDELMHNKIRYFNFQLEKLEEKISVLEEDKNQLFEKHKNVIMLIEENKIDEYTSLQSKLAEYNEELGSNKNIRSIYNLLESRVAKLVKQLEETEAEATIKEDSLSIFNKYFSQYSEKTNGESFMLYKTEKGFPFGIDNVKRGLSTGTRKSIIVAFDLAYQQLAKDLEKKVPNFIVHDVIETIDKVALNAIITIVNSIECQYIVAVLKEKIQDIDLQKSNIAVTFSENDRPFRI